jgi:hypothetical protein
MTRLSTGSFSITGAGVLAGSGCLPGLRVLSRVRPNFEGLKIDREHDQWLAGHFRF